MTKRAGLSVSVVIVAVAAFANSAGAHPPRAPRPDFTYTETVRRVFVNGRLVPMFAIVDTGIPNTTPGDTLNFTADVVGEDRQGRLLTGELFGTCTAAGFEPRSSPACNPGQNPATCVPDPNAPLYICTNVLALDDNEDGNNGISTLVTQGAVRQLAAGGDPPGTNVSPSWLAVTGGTGRFSKSRGQVRTELRQSATPPPLKETQVFLD